MRIFCSVMLGMGKGIFWSVNQIEKEKLVGFFKDASERTEKACEGFRLLRKGRA